MIQLTKDLWLKADEYQYIVGKPVESRGNGAELRNPRYYPTMAQAVSATLEITLRKGVADGTITTLREFIHEQERLWDELERLIAPLECGQPRQTLVEAHQAAETGKDISQPLDGEKEV